MSNPVRHTAINSILLNYEILLSTLETVKDGHDEYAAKAHGLHMRMESFYTYFGLKLAYAVFSATEQFSVNLQSRNITVQEAIRGAQLLVSHLKSLRTEAQFDAFNDQALVQSSTLTEEPQLPRYRKLPKKLDEGDCPHCYTSPKDKYRHDYFEMLELATGEIERRFEQPDFVKIKEIESLLLNAANGEVIFELVSKFLENDVDAERLKVQLLMVADMIKIALVDRMTVKEVTNVRTIADAMQQSEIYKGMLTEIDKLLRIYRTSMTHYRLNNLFLLHLHVIKTDSLDLKAIARDFVRVNLRRMHYFGKF